MKKLLIFLLVPFALFAQGKILKGSGYAMPPMYQIVVDTNAIQNIGTQQIPHLRLNPKLLADTVKYLENGDSPTFGTVNASELQISGTSIFSRANTWTADQSVTGTIIARRKGGNIRISNDLTDANDFGIYTTGTSDGYFSNWNGDRGIKVASDGVHILGTGALYAGAGNFGGALYFGGGSGTSYGLKKLSNYTTLYGGSNGILLRSQDDTHNFVVFDEYDKSALFAGSVGFSSTEYINKPAPNEMRVYANSYFDVYTGGAQRFVVSNSGADVSGALNVTGAGTFGGEVKLSTQGANLIFTNGGQSIYYDGTTFNMYAATGMKLQTYNYGSGSVVDALQIAYNTGNATFAGSGTFGGDIKSNGSNITIDPAALGNNYILVKSYNASFFQATQMGVIDWSWGIKNGSSNWSLNSGGGLGGTDVLTFSTDGNATFAGNISATVPTYSDNAAAITGGLSAGAFYKTSTGQLMIVY